MKNIFSKSVTIPTGQSLSNSVYIGDWDEFGIILPTIDSATITFQVSADDKTFFDLYDGAGSEVTLGTATTGNRAVYPTEAVHPWPYLKIRSGTSAFPVNQTSDRKITVVGKQF